MDIKAFCWAQSNEMTTNFILLSTFFNVSILYYHNRIPFVHYLTCVSVVVGQYLGETGRHIEAADSYLSAARILPHDFELIFNTANALR